jgi:hypothetical protein
MNATMDLHTLLPLSGLTITGLILLPFAFTYLTTLSISKFGIKGISTNEEPPPVPYCVPFVGNAVALAIDTLGCLSSITLVSHSSFLRGDG